MEPISVLLVEDEEDLSQAMAERLEMRGCRARGVTTSEEALQIIENTDFDVAVIDIKMPGIGGLELMRLIKRQKPDTRIILFTGHGSNREGELGISEGAYDYLIKPVKIDDLMETIKRAVGR